MDKKHTYCLSVVWTGKNGTGTSGYADYDRSHTIEARNKTSILGSAAPEFRGDASKYNPEELFLASISTCHMLWYLHLCAEAGIVVIDYTDHPVGVMEESKTGGRFVEVTLHPQVKILETSTVEVAIDLHKKANELCFIANSLNFKVKHEAVVYC